MKHAPRMSRESEGDGRCMVYGRQPVLEVLRARRRPFFRLHILGSDGRSEGVPEIVEAARVAGVTPQSADRAFLERLTQGGHHQGVLLEAGPYPYADFHALLEKADAKKPPLWLLLDHLEDTHNVGALLRTAEAVGVTGVVLPQDRSVEVTAAVIRASAGAAEHVRVCRVVNLVRAMKELQEAGVWIHGLEAVPEAKPYAASDLKGPIGIVVGGEGKGIGRLVRETCDFLIRIPLLGKITSLNASVAGAVVLYEVVRQREG